MGTRAMLPEALNRPWHATLVGGVDQVQGVDRQRHMITLEGVAVTLGRGIVVYGALVHNAVGSSRKAQSAQR